MEKTKVVNMRTDEWDIKIDRSTVFGNRFIEGEDGDREEVILKYRLIFYTNIKRDPAFKEAVERLRGKRLGCWCKPEPCHGDVIVEYLEGEADPE